MFLYCRLCAEPKVADELLNLDGDERKCTEVMTKLHSMYVDVSDRSSLPKTVCFYCYDSLNKAFDFLDKVKKAQEILAALIAANECARYALSDDEGQVFDDLFNAPCIISEVKTEKSSPEKHALEPLIKIEPKDEDLEATGLTQIAVEPYVEKAISVHKLLKSTKVNVRRKIRIRKVPQIKTKTNSWKEYPWCCKFCNINFMDLEILRSHSKASHTKCAAFSCSDCKSFHKHDSFDAFLDHVRLHRTDLRNRCQYCDQIVDRGNLTAHLKLHFLKANVVCEFCGEILENDETLQQHLSEFVTVKRQRKPRRKAGTPLTVEDLTCHICKKVYKNPNSLRDHIKRHSDRKRNYTCDRCGKTFFNKGTLTSHVMNHDDIRPHVCRICNKSFLFPNMLRRHVEMHSGVKPFSCEVCGRCFRLQYQLNAHKIVHTDSMPYVCQYCNKAFRFKQILKSHERQHTGSKPYSCQLCCMEFSNWSNYNKHMKRRHNADMSKKKITPMGTFPVNPETGQIIEMNVEGMDEWKSKVMIPAKRGKKKGTSYAV